MGVKFKSNIKVIQRDLEAYDKKRAKAGQTAVKVEGYKLSKSLKDEIRAGAPGGHAFSPLSQIAIRRRYRNKNKPPLYRMAIPVRYRTDYRDGNMYFSVGFVDPYKGEKLSKSWKRLAILNQTGAKMPVTPELRDALLEMGARLKKRKNTRNQANVFFLKDSTTQINIPARPIIEPFWTAHKSKTARNIFSSFHRKMAGERI